MNEIRQLAVRLLLDVIDRTANPAEHADIEAWVDSRSEDEGGFLWLAGLLNAQPNRLDEGIRSLLQAPKHWHDSIKKLLIRVHEAD